MSYEYVRAHRQRRTIKAREHLGGSCARCGTAEDLQFDHVDPQTKVIAISDAIAKGWAWDRLVGE